MLALVELEHLDWKWFLFILILKTASWYQFKRFDKLFKCIYAGLLKYNS